MIEIAITVILLALSRQLFNLQKSLNEIHITIFEFYSLYINRSEK